MAEQLTINNLENGVKIARRNRPPTRDSVMSGDIEDGSLKALADKPELNERISQVKQGDEINCNDNNYYYEEKDRNIDPYPGTYTKKISSEYDVRQLINKNKKVYRVKRLDRPFGEGFANSVTGFFKKSDAPAGNADPAAPAAPVETPAAPVETPAATGGRRSRNQRKSRRSRKQRNQRKSRKQRRSRR